jgi:hypothetical protein
MNIDEGYMLEEETNSDHLSFTGSRETSEYFKDSAILKIGFNLDTNFDTINIAYKKVQGVIAEVGGFINILVIITGYIVTKIKDKDYITEIIDDIFYLK